MLKTVTVYTCDNCQSEIENDQHEELVFHVNGRQFVSHWCATCFAALMSALDQPSPAETERTCSCGFEAKTVAGLRTHQSRKKHS